MNNQATSRGGGVFGGELNNCVIASNTAGYGGGAIYSELNNCLIIANRATAKEGGATFCKLNHCTIAGNSTAGDIGGVTRSTRRYCVLFDNTADSGANHNYYGSDFFDSCTTPDPRTVNASDGFGDIITNAPEFSDAANGDYTLSPMSPCIDAGITTKDLFNQTDVVGNPRVLNSGVDIGAYEFVFEADVRAALAGAFDASQNRMRTMVSPPLSAPYASDIAVVDALATGIVDWVLLELRPSITSAPSTQVSAVIRSGGRIVDASSGQSVLLESKGLQYLVLRHRNHLAVMTPGAITTNRMFAYDFTTGFDKYYGGTSAGIHISGGPGDCDRAMSTEMDI